MTTETLTLVNTKDGEKIAVWKVTAHKNPKPINNTVVKGQNVFLTHGTFSNKKVCLRIAEYLAEIGHDCYIMEWRGHGDSSIPKHKFNFETIATYDYEATFRYLFEELELDNLHCVTHSGGGVCLAMFLVQNVHYIDKLNSITTFACQAYGAISSPKSHARIVATKLFNRLLGYIPAKKLNMGPVNESYYTMRQWYDWNLNKDFKSSFIHKNDMTQEGIKQDTLYQHSLYQHTLNKNNSCSDKTDKKPKTSSPNDKEYIDYRQYMSKITTPIYAISAKGDNFISPTNGCQLFFANFTNPTNIFHEYSKANGNLEDYDHTRILVSRNAATEIWPTVANWIAAHIVSSV